MKLKLFIFSVLLAGFLAAENPAALISTKDLLSLKVWSVEGGAKVEIDEKEKTIKLLIPAEAKNAPVILEVKKITKEPWWGYNTLKMDLNNSTKSKVTLRFRLVRRALDDLLLQAEHPRYDKDVVLEPGNNSLEIDVTEAGNNPSREIMVEQLKLIFSNGEKAAQSFVLSKFLLEQTEE